MNSAKIINAILLAAAACLVAWGLVFFAGSQTQPLGDISHPLPGTLSGSSYAYRETGEYYTIEVEYPATTGLSAGADRAARGTLEAALAARVAEFKENGNFANLTPEDVQIQGLGPDRQYALGMEYREYRSADTVSYLYTVYEDTLGAHPNAYFMTFVFDRNGKRLGITDIVGTSPRALEVLAAAVSAGVSAQMQARLGPDFSASALFSEGLQPKVENFSTFVLDGDTLVVAIPPYQVAAYAAGSFEVPVPLSALR